MPLLINYMQEGPQLPAWLVAERGETMQLIDKILQRPDLAQCVVQAENPYPNEQIRYEYRNGNRVYTIIVFGESNYSREKPAFAPHYMFEARIDNGTPYNPSDGDVKADVDFAGRRRFEFYYPPKPGERFSYRDDRQDNTHGNSPEILYWQEELMGKTGSQALMEILKQFESAPASEEVPRSAMVKIQAFVDVLRSAVGYRPRYDKPKR